MAFKRLALALAVPALCTCVHLETPREPAAVAEKKIAPLTCEQAFKATFDVESLDMITELGARVFGTIRDFTDGFYPDIIREFMSRAARPPDCETERDVDLYAADISGKSRMFDAHDRTLRDQTLTQKVLTAPGWTNENLANAFACFSECKKREWSTPSQTAPNCQSACGMTEGLADFVLDSTAMQRVSDACFATLDKKNAAELKAEYARRFLDTVPRFLRRLTELGPSIAAEFEKDKRSKTALASLRAEFAKFKSSRRALKCGPAHYSFASTARAATVLLRSEDEEGSGFYVQVPSGRYLATAAHVPEMALRPPAERDQETRRLSLKANGKSKFTADGAFFAIEPGLVNLALDVALEKVAKAGPSLEPPPEGEAPRAGQRFYVTGFPSFGNGRFQIVRCTFLGYGPRLREKQTDAAYKLRCPGVGDLHGISGGAMVDERGRVWGINSSSEPATSSFSAIPLSRREDGTLVVGIQTPLVTDLCYDALEFTPHRCQVMPNMYEKGVSE